MCPFPFSLSTGRFNLAVFGRICNTQTHTDFLSDYRSIQNISTVSVSTIYNIEIKIVDIADRWISIFFYSYDRRLDFPSAWLTCVLSTSDLSFCGGKISRWTSLIGYNKILLWEHSILHNIHRTMYYDHTAF
jgi:hypothetical protein